MLSWTGLSHAFGPTQIFDSVTITLGERERVGLIGPNGAGKSTLLKILMGLLAPDAGVATPSRDLRLGYLPQHGALLHTGTVEAALRTAQATLYAQQQELETLASQLATADTTVLPALLERYGTLAEAFERAGGYELEHTRARVRSGLGLDHLDDAQPVASLSGGEQTRLGLAVLLLQAPDVLILDEPTNHLDFAMARWLEEFLTAHAGALLVVSHDRQFLNRTVTRIWDLDERKHTIVSYSGNYDAYTLARQHERENWEQSYLAQQAEIAELRERMRPEAHRIGHNRSIRDGNKLSYNAHGQRVQKTLSRNIRAAAQELERIMADPIPAPPEPLVFQGTFSAVRSEGALALEAINLTWAVNAQTIVAPTSFTLAPTQRVAIVGPNGAGKSSLLRMLAGELEPTAGLARLSPDCVLGYLAQTVPAFSATTTIIDYYCQDRIGYREELINELLSWGLFEYAEIERRMAYLSLGQVQKAQLARLLAARPNLLLLDEPTNHLSFDVLEQFEAALREFPGAILAVSHDRWFLERFIGEQWLLIDGVLERDPQAALAYASEG